MKESLKNFHANFPQLRWVASLTQFGVVLNTFEVIGFQYFALNRIWRWPFFVGKSIADQPLLSFL